VFLYLHGFASGPASTKAQFFAARLRALGATVEIPDLAPDFTHMTIASMLGIVQRWEARIGPAAVAAWRTRRVAPVFHYGRGGEEALAFDILEDGRRWPEEPDPPPPTLAFAVRYDEAVPLDAVTAFARKRPERRELVVMDSGHELTDVLEPMWERTLAFLRRVRAV